MDSVQILKHLEEVINAAGFENCLLIMGNGKNMQMLKIQPVVYPIEEALFDGIIAAVIKNIDSKKITVTKFDENYQQPEKN